jgi:predicted nucleotidyltransferase
MAIMFHPSKANAERLRVYDRSLGIQKYIPITGSIEKAQDQARKIEAQVEEKKKIKSIRVNLPINKIFTSENKVKGLQIRSRRYGKKNHNMFVVYRKSSTHNSNLSVSVSIDKYGAKQAFMKIINKVSDYYAIDFDLELKELAKKSFKKHYSPLTPYYHRKTCFTDCNS